MTVMSNLVLTTELSKLATLKGSFFYPLRWPIYVFNSVVNTKLPAILSHRRTTTVSLETYPFYSYDCSETRLDCQNITLAFKSSFDGYLSWLP